MSDFTGYTVLGFWLIVIGAAAYAIVVYSWRLVQDDGELRLERMLKRHGANLELSGGGFSASRAAVAVRRCVACPDKPACDAWLASVKREGAADFCPNAAFVQDMAHKT